MLFPGATLADPPAVHDAAERNRAQTRARSKAARDSAAAIPELPAVANQKRRESCRLDLAKFLKVYFPQTTGLTPLSDDHIRAAKRMQGLITGWGLLLQIVYRSWAKSTLSENACLFAALYGHTGYIVPIASDAKAAQKMLDSIKAELLTNDLLAEDFPEVCLPIRALENKVQRARYQTYRGERTGIVWTNDKIVLPTIPGSAASGVIIEPRGLTSSIRGMRHKRDDGIQQRPTLAIVDDPQTDESARSPKQCQDRLDLLTRTVAQLGGKQRISIVVNATVICADDMVDQLSNRNKYPAWQVERIPMVRAWSKRHDDLWLGNYATLRNAYNPDVPGDQERAQAVATKFYRANRKAMDEGCVVSWKHRFAPPQLSAIQNAYDLLIDFGLEVFEAEYQNNPRAGEDAVPELAPQRLRSRMSPWSRHELPTEAETLTAHIDVHNQILYWTVLGTEAEWSSYATAYGTYPKQPRRYFAHAAPPRTLAQLYPKRPTADVIEAALDDLVGELASREWVDSAGVPRRLARLGVDANGEHSDRINKFCRKSPHAAILVPMYGAGITAKKKPIAQWKEARKRKNRGPEWLWLRPKPGHRPGIMFNTNYWKRQVHEALAVDESATGALLLHADDPENHRLYVDHVTSETAALCRYDNRETWEFSLTPNADNHFFDTLVGAYTLASVAGVEKGATKRKIIRASELRKAA